MAYLLNILKKETRTNVIVKKHLDLFRKVFRNSNQNNFSVKIRTRRSGLNHILIKHLKTYQRREKKNLLVICPGFSSDCVETLEEIAIQGKDSFIQNGGNNFELVPCLNDNDDHIKLIEHLIKRYLVEK